MITLHIIPLLHSYITFMGLNNLFKSKGQRLSLNQSWSVTYMAHKPDPAQGASRQARSLCVGEWGQGPSPNQVWSLIVSDKGPAAH